MSILSLVTVAIVSGVAELGALLWNVLVHGVAALFAILAALHVAEFVCLRLAAFKHRRSRVGYPYSPPPPSTGKRRRRDAATTPTQRSLTQAAASLSSDKPVQLDDAVSGNSTPSSTPLPPQLDDALPDQPTVVITGGAMGIGRELVLRYGKLGYRVIVWDIEPSAALAKAQEVVTAEVNNAYARIEFHHVDVSNFDEVSAAASQLVDTRGITPTLLILNAGIVTGNRLVDCTSRATVRRSCHLIDVNVKQLYMVTGCLLPSMVLAGTSEEVQTGKPRHRAVVVMGSVAGFAGTARMADYNASKAAANVFGEAISAELAALPTGRVNIHVTVVCPYMVSTGMFAGTTNVVGFRELTPTYVADSIVRAVYLRKRLLVMPRILLYWVALKALVPWFTLPWIDALLGGSRAMDTFLGRTGAAHGSATQKSASPANRSPAIPPHKVLAGDRMPSLDQWETESNHTRNDSVSSSDRTPLKPQRSLLSALPEPLAEKPTAT
jgi:all-trans-retinol dehydrogenase (NAD+)